MDRPSVSCREGDIVSRPIITKRERKPLSAFVRALVAVRNYFTRYTRVHPVDNVDYTRVRGTFGTMETQLMGVI